MATRRVNLFEQHFLFSNRLVQIILSLRPDQNSNDQLSLFPVIIIYVSPGILHQFYQLFTSDFKLETTVKLLQKLITSLDLLFIYSSTYIGFVRMKLLFTNFKYYYERLSDEDEIDIMKKYTNQTKSYVYILMVLFYVYATLILSPCILKVLLYHFGVLNDDQLTLPIPVNNVTKGGSLYYCLTIYQISVIIIIAMTGSMSLSAYLIAVQHACYQLDVIICKIWQPFEKHSKYTQKAWSIKTPSLKWEWIVDIIMRYKNVTEYVDLLNNFSKINYLVTIFLAMILIVFDYVYIFQLSKLSQNVIETIECSIYSIGSVFVLYLNFYLGQKLLNHSEAVFEELNKIPFYTFSINYQKLLLFIIVRSGRPCVLSIGGIFVSSHVTFAGLMRKAFSVATVWYTVQ